MDIGFVGFGEAAYHIAKGLRPSGVTIRAFDIHQDTPKRRDLIRQRANETGTELMESNAALALASSLILSTVTADQAVVAAEQTAPHLGAGHLYADLNSVSPGTKRNINEIISARGAKFAEVAVMAPVPPSGHRVPLLIGGAGAEEFLGLLQPLGMRIEVSPGELGTASATKMCRSIVVKGIEAVVTECVMSATHYGVDENVLKSLNETFSNVQFEKLASYLVSRVAVHGERRTREMEEVVKTVEEAGVEDRKSTRLNSSHT